ncbi:MAG TPA: hypothetical protein VEA99_05180 [Gemmatimonadaceae bacterium]|nr:hypothetical protein [Gemmatimonadaceae bacterium]
MTTKLTKPIRREIEVDGKTYTLHISAEGVRLTRKRFRSGRALSWRAFLAGDGGKVVEEEE